MLRNLSIVYVFYILLCCDLWKWSQAEVFTAISEVEPLLETHQRIIEDLDDYLRKEEQRILILKKHLNTYKREHNEAMKDIPNYLGNPINAFTLIKRLTSDLDEIEQSIKIGTEYIKNISINHEDVKYPTLEDLSGAANALTRLQETYQLSITDLSEGILNGIRYSAPMSSSDCYELGKALYTDKDYNNSISWMKEALRKYRENPDEFYPFIEVDIMEYISFAYYLSNDVRSALDWTLEVLAIDPHHPRIAGNVPHFKKFIQEEEEKKKAERRGETGTKEDEPEEETWYKKERKRYESLCRGEIGIPSEVSSKLTCRYLTENHPFLRLAPIKMEQHYIKPDIFVFYDVMSDDEIEYIKEMAKPRFKRAVVHDPKTGELIPASYRISKSAWLKDEEDELVARISRRITDFTNLSMAYAEELQVVNYGIGGHYEPHYDFSRKDERAFADFAGNRIATVLFYMSDVAQGGATVFTELGLSVFPVKNAAVFWLNLHPSGQGDLATRHAACPVLRGSKWVSNKWIHEGGQELKMPCDLEYQEESIIRKLPLPVPKSSRSMGLNFTALWQC